MTNVTMKAIDTLHISSVGPENIAPGEEFDVSTGVADDLESRGLAKRVGASKEAPAAPENKMEAAPENKGLISSMSKKAGK